MVTALTLGIGIDYSIHMWRRFEVELSRRNNHWDALRASISTTGVALIMSALTTALGFLVLMFFTYACDSRLRPNNCDNSILFSTSSIGTITGCNGTFRKKPRGTSHRERVRASVG